MPVAAEATPSAAVAAAARAGQAAATADDTRTLTQWLRLLWSRSPKVVRDSPQVYIADGAIHLPQPGPWRQHRAAAAHAAAHLVYSPRQFDGQGLGPLARTLASLLEDARVEALAGRELPGLLRMWRQLHTVTPDAGSGLPALLQRLARALVDPQYVDPHPWIAKGRRLCFLDAPQALLALRTAAEVVQGARLLGHDIGQQRLAFDAHSTLSLPPYRDDSRWMWPSERPPEPVQSPPQPLAMPESELAVEPPVDGGEPDAPPLATLPEWDRLIGRLRPRWCTLVPAAGEPSLPSARQTQADLLAQQRQRLRLGVTVPRWRGRCAQGAELDLDALLQARLALRQGRPVDGRVYRDRHPLRAPARVWLLIDQSASSARVVGPEGQTLLTRAVLAAWSLLLALQALGVPCAVAGFRSRGRHAVEWQRLKRFEDPVDPGLAERLQALRGAGSTRLGAVVRHAAGDWGPAARGLRWLVLFSDGEPHDVDVHDPRYLVEDARHAVRAARAHAVRTLCLSPDPEVSPTARRIFGADRSAAVAGPPALSAALRRMRV
jgi:nitric oxide reductase activation protein